MTQDNKLMPCPIDGGENLIVYPLQLRKTVRCKDCGCEAPLDFWNIRCATPRPVVPDGKPKTLAQVIHWLEQSIPILQRDLNRLCELEAAAPPPAQAENQKDSWVGSHVRKGWIAFDDQLFDPEFYQIVDKTEQAVSMEAVGGKIFELIDCFPAKDKLLASLAYYTDTQGQQACSTTETFETAIALRTLLEQAKS